MEKKEVREFLYVEDCFDVYAVTTTTLRRQKPFTHTKITRTCKICGRIESRRQAAIKHARTHQSDKFTSKCASQPPTY